MVVIGPAGSLADALLLAKKSLPDAAVLDVRLEVGTSLPFPEWLAERHILFVSDERSNPHRCHAFCRSRAAQANLARAARCSACRIAGQNTVIA
jgi:hypothetical protein